VSNRSAEFKTGYLMEASNNIRLITQDEFQQWKESPDTLFTEANSRIASLQKELTEIKAKQEEQILCIGKSWDSNLKPKFSNRSSSESY
jgi:hypothetical protein